jgi:hypothetical protein
MEPSFSGKKILKDLAISLPYSDQFIFAGNQKITTFASFKL